MGWSIKLGERIPFIALAWSIMYGLQMVIGIIEEAKRIPCRKGGGRDGRLKQKRSFSMPGF